MTKFMSLVAAASGAVVLAASAAPASAAPVREHAVFPPRASSYGLAAGYGYLAWIDAVRTGRRRIAVRQPDGATRRTWLAGALHQNPFELRRDIDPRTGRPVTRLIVTGRHLDGSQPTTVLSPDTLRPVKTMWATSSQGTAVDGAASVTSAVEPDSSAPADPTKLPPTRCTFSVAAGLPAVPALADCNTPGLILRGSVLTSFAGVPSDTSADRDRGQVNGAALSRFSTQHPALGWQRLATRVDDHGATTGLQSYCVSDRGIALLEGERRPFLDQRVATWTLRWIPADPTESETVATVPQLDQTANSDVAGSVRIACAGTAIYAEYAKPSRKDPLTGATRVVRFTLPK